MSHNAIARYLVEVLGVKSWISPQVQGRPNWREFLYEFDGLARSENYEKAWDIIFIHLSDKSTAVQEKFENQSESSFFSGPNNELFQKMKLAMKLGTASVLELEISSDVVTLFPYDFQNWMAENFSFKCVVIFSQNPVKFKDSPLWIQTWSPYAMIQNESLKKSAWLALQRARARF